MTELDLPLNKETFVSLILDRLTREKDALALQYQNPEGTATRHLIIDNLFPPEITKAIYDAFPSQGEGFKQQDSFREHKKTSSHINQYAPILQDVTYALQDPRIVKLVGEITGIPALEPDPMLYAGGLSMMFQGDFLNPHIDNSHDGNRQKFRQLNLLFYVSPEWGEGTGGNFELWNDDRTMPKTLHSRFNRLVVMETNKTSWHSVSKVTVPRVRCCLSNYFYSEESPDGTDYYHYTSFEGRPDDELSRKAKSKLDHGLRSVMAKVIKPNKN